VLRLDPPVANPVVIQPFGVNLTGDPTFYTQFGLPAHEGIDFRAPHGTPVLACADGVVTRIERIVGPNAYGIQIRIEHRVSDGIYETVYGHLASVGAVWKVGSHLLRGQQIGLSDNTGHSRGDHLHLTLKRRGNTAAGIKQQLGDGGWALYPSDIVDPTPFFAW
jgi:murein DD-endopeptidase MepM/ murein hydrolase activator NlpD